MMVRFGLYLLWCVGMVPLLVSTMPLAKNYNTQGDFMCIWIAVAVLTARASCRVEDVCRDL